MDGGVSSLADGLEGTNVDNREWTIRGTRLNERLLSVFVREAVDEGLGTGSPSRGVPPKDATEPRAQSEQGAHDGVERHEILGAHEGSRVGKCAVESTARKVDHPHIVERDVGEKRMHPKIKPSKFPRIYARPRPHLFLFAAAQRLGNKLPAPRDPTTRAPEAGRAMTPDRPADDRCHRAPVSGGRSASLPGWAATGVTEDVRSSLGR